MRKKFHALAWFTIFAVLFVCFSQACFADETEAGRDDSNIHIVITFLGDCTLGAVESDYESPRSFIAYAENNGLGYFFSEVQSVLANDDLTVANLESVFSDDSSTQARNKTYCFRAPVSYAEMLNLASIEAVSFGNNHSMDYGVSGALSTVAALEAVGVDWFGANPDYTTNQYPDGISKPWIYEKDGVKIGFVASYISAFWIKAAEYGEEYKIQRTQVEELKAQGCDLIIACMHGGVEYDRLHDSNQENFANAYFEYGADIVIGNHPHRLQGMTVDEKGTVCYSLGNFCFGGNKRIHVGAETTCIFQFDFEFDRESHAYLGYTLTLYPAVPGSFVDEEYTDYQPKLVNGKEAEDILYEIQRDTRPRTLKLNPYIDGIGAVQEFVPNSKLNR